MDKKMIFGILLTVIGLFFTAFCFVDAVLNYDFRLRCLFLEGV